MAGARVLVLGGYGFIGREIVRALEAQGFAVVGFGRSAAKARQAAPHIPWRMADMARLKTADDWAPLIAGVDAVVNAAGVLQDGARDDVAAVQARSVMALIAACERAGVRRFVQISAPGAAQDARTAFLRTKGEADAALTASTLDWTILRPGLVIGANAYGGTTLLRMLAAFPLVQPLTLADRRIQTVAAADVAAAACAALAAGAPVRIAADLVEADAHALEDVVARMRVWLGFAPARAVVRLPSWLGGALARVGDLAGWLGWRAPLRTTALRVLGDDVVGTPARPARSLDATLASLPATAQERVYARAMLALPAMVVSLALFWLASGAIALWRTDAAAAVLDGTALAAIARPLVLAGAGVDIAIGCALLVRPWTQAAAVAAIVVSGAYLALAAVVTPWLWADPLGPMVKVIPQMALALAVALMTLER